jgi:hypothetical protein
MARVDKKLKLNNVSCKGEKKCEKSKKHGNWNLKPQNSNPNPTQMGISFNIKRIWIQVFYRYPLHIFPLSQV